MLILVILILEVLQIEILIMLEELLTNNKDKENRCFIYFGKLTEKEKDEYIKYCKNIDMIL